MTIETKYNVEDMVWLMCENKPINQKVLSVFTTSSIEGGKLKTSTCYNIQFCTPTYKDDDLFQTKEELLQLL